VAGAVIGTITVQPATARAQSHIYPKCATQPTPEDVEAAKGSHKAAQQFYAKARYDRAIQAWTDAYSFDCTAHRLLINIGNAYEKLGQPQDAIAAFEVYIARSGDKAEPTILDKVENLKQQLANRPADSGQPDAGAPRDGDGNTGIGIAAGPIILMGLGGAVSIAGIVVWGVGESRIAAVREECGSERNGDKQLVCHHDPTLLDRGHDANTMVYVGVGVTVGGLAMAGGAVAWHFFAPTGGQEAASADGFDFRIDPWLGPGIGGLGVSGSF